jgi:serine/threonine protein kinase
VSDVVAGLAALHAHGSPHRDLKPSNVMQQRSTQRCKLIDWIGRAAEDASLARSKPVGTPVFMAPEVAGAPHRHGLASDSWALGCTVLMSCGWPLLNSVLNDYVPKSTRARWNSVQLPNATRRCKCGCCKA